MKLKKNPFLFVFVCFSIGATICKRQQILGRVRHRVAMSVCMYDCDVAKHPLPGVVETSGQRTKRGVLLIYKIVNTHGFWPAHCG